MPTTGRAAASSNARPARKSSQSAADYQQQKREKTRSTPSSTYVQGRPRKPSTTQVTGADPAQHAQRPFKGRAHSAPLVPKVGTSYNPGGPSQEVDDDGSESDDAGLFDDEPSDDEAIADDPFFQRFDLPQQSASKMNDPRGSFLDHDHTGSEEEDTEGPLSPTSTVTRARPDSTAEPLQSPLNPNSPTSVCFIASKVLDCLLTRRTVAREQRTSSGDQHRRRRISSCWEICFHTKSLQFTESSIKCDIFTKNVNRWKCLCGTVDRVSFYRVGPGQ